MGLRSLPGRENKQKSLAPAEQECWERSQISEARQFHSPVPAAQRTRTMGSGDRYTGTMRFYGVK